MESLLYDVTALATIRLTDKPIHFMVDVDTTVPDYLIGDMTRVKQILVNIVGNAVKFTEQGFIKVMVSTFVKDKFTYLQFQVSDSGIGSDILPPPKEVGASRSSTLTSAVSTS